MPSTNTSIVDVVVGGVGLPDPDTLPTNGRGEVGGEIVPRAGALQAERTFETIIK